MELKLLLLPGHAGTAGTAGRLRRGQTVQLNKEETMKSVNLHRFYDIHLITCMITAVLSSRDSTCWIKL